MGTITVAPKSGNKNFDGTKTQKFDIKGTVLNGTLKVYGSNKKEIAPTVVNSVNTNMISWNSYHFYYNGAECKFADAAFLPAIAAAKEGTDYEIKYINNVNAGYGYVAVVAKGNYEGNLNAKLCAKRKDIDCLPDWFYGEDDVRSVMLRCNGADASPERSTIEH